MDNNYGYLKDLLIETNDILDSILSGMEHYSDLFPDDADKDDVEEADNDIFSLLESMYKLANDIKEKEYSLRKNFYERLSFYGDECDE